MLEFEGHTFTHTSQKMLLCLTWFLVCEASLFPCDFTLPAGNICDQTWLLVEKGDIAILYLWWLLQKASHWKIGFVLTPAVCTRVSCPRLPSRSSQWWMSEHINLSSIGDFYFMLKMCEIQLIYTSTQWLVE